MWALGCIVVELATTRLLREERLRHGPPENARDAGFTGAFVGNIVGDRTIQQWTSKHQPNGLKIGLLPWGSDEGALFFSGEYPCSHFRFAKQIEASLHLRSLLGGNKFC